MARAEYKLPNVFVGCPYSKEFNYSAFKTALDRIPFRWYYADTHLTTKHLLGILTSYIKAVDYCIFERPTTGRVRRREVARRGWAHSSD